MKVIIPLLELSRKVSAISTVVPSKTTMPILSTMLIGADGNGITFSATDLDISVTSKVKGRVEVEGKIAVPGKKIAEIVKSLSGDEVILEADREKLTIICCKSRFVVNGRSSDDFPTMPKQEGKTSFTINPGLLLKLIQKSIYAVSTDLTRPALCGVLWEVDRNRLAMISTDGHRLAKVETKIELPDVKKMDVIVPPKALSTLKAYAEGEEKIDVDIGENSISFEMSGTSIYSRLFEGPFPNYQKVIPAANEKELVVTKSVLADATRRVAILSDALTHQVIFSLDKDKLKLHVSTQEIGEASEEIEASFSSDPLEIGYNASYILDIMRTIDSDEISFLLDRPDNAGLIKPVSQEADIKQVCIIMPLRIG